MLSTNCSELSIGHPLNPEYWNCISTFCKWHISSFWIDFVISIKSLTVNAYYAPKITSNFGIKLLEIAQRRSTVVVSFELYIIYVQDVLQTWPILFNYSYPIGLIELEAYSLGVPLILHITCKYLLQTFKVLGACQRPQLPFFLHFQTLEFALWI